MEHQTEPTAKPVGLVLILLSCLPLLVLVFLFFADKPGDAPLVSTLSWSEWLLLIICLALPGLILPKAGIHWRNPPR